MLTKYESYYPKIQKAKEKFDFFLEKIKSSDNFEEKNEGLLSLIEMAVYNNVGIWTSSYIEKFYTDYAKTIDIDYYNINYQPNSFLHVLTKGSKTGGHTRVVERWINNAPKNQKHSVVFISPNNDEMTLIEQNVKEKNGNCIYFDNNLSMKEKALKLRKLGLHYQFIILHTHMEEVIPLIAFGTEKFTRPVLLYNHASHMFWLGKSISDIVLDIEKDDEITRIKRNIKDTFFLGVPSKKINFEKKDEKDKQEIRKKLGLPIDKKIIISSGAEQKYIEICNDSYIDVIKKIVDEDTYCFIIGIKKNNKKWKKIEKNGHIVPLGYINFNEGYLDYLACGDLYIDSYPFCGGTASIDAISQSTPVLSLKSVYPQFDYLTSTQAYCLNENDFIQKAKKVLTDSSYKEALLKELQNSLNEYQSKEVWNKKIEDLIKTAPQTHKVKDLSEEKDYQKIDDLSVLINVMTDKSIEQNQAVLKMIKQENFEEFKKYGIKYKTIGIPQIIEFVSYKKANKKTKIFKIL